MTTVDKAHDLFMSFKGRSPKQIYMDACHDLDVKSNSALSNSLSTTIDDFYNLTELVLSGNYLGRRGSLAVIPLVQCQQNLTNLEMKGCGVGDEMVKQLVETLQDHPNIRTCDLSDNLDISVYSGQLLVTAVKRNINLVDVNLTGTHIGDNVNAVLKRMCDENRTRMEHYFKDDWFLLKDMFTGLDVDGSGWVNIKNVVGSVPYPMIKEKLEERIRITKPKKREDNSVDVNAFMLLAYCNYKTLDDIADRAKLGDDIAKDTVRNNIIKNWAILLKEMTAAQVTCPELHKLRIRTRVLTEAAAQGVVADAIEHQKEQDGIPANSETKPPIISTLSLFKGYKEAGSPSPRGRKHASFLSLDLAKRKVWQMTPVMLKSVLAFYEDAPPQGLSAQEVLENAKFETEFEFLKLDVLRENFSRYALPLEETLITRQEAVNMLDEYYDVVRINKPLTVETIQKLVAEVKANVEDDE